MPPFALRVAAALVPLSLALAACTDRNPAAAGPEPARPPSSLSMMTCTVSVQAGTMHCGTPGAGSGVSAAVLGNQGENVRLRSTGMSYDGTSTFRMDVTVENLTGQALGTADGVTPSADGVRVFFHSGPVATGGQGSVAVQNADGEGIFLAPGQKYFQYDGLLPPGDTTPAKEWRFTLPNTVTSFGFSVYLAAPVRAEAGWISMLPVAAAVAVGDTQRVAATVRTLTGGAADGVAAWTSSNGSVATVDAQGLVTGVAAGVATITATSGARTGSVQVVVHAPTFNPPPTFLRFTVEGASVTSGSPADSVKFRLEYRNTGGFSAYMRVSMRHATGIQRECASNTGFGWAGENREYTCGFALPDGLLGGAWRVERIEFSGRTVQHAALLAAGAPAYVHVHTAVEDRDGPTLDSLIIHSDTINVGNGRTLDLDLWAGDRMYTDRAEAFLSSAGNPRLTFFGSPRTPANGRTPYQFRNQIPYYYHSGEFVLDSLRLRDTNGNRRTITQAELAARGHRTQFTVTGTAADTFPPQFSAFSFSPDSVVGNGADTVTVMLAAEETVDESGVRFLDMEFERMDDTTQRRRCLKNAPTREWYLEMTCKLVFSAADVGTWRVRYVRAIDFMNNEAVGFTADLQALGIPTELVVTPP
ncbi:MAG TPA: Ig-like domain-containing protein [Longimicrobium sp.]|nr:Ig-like domain-containing protein [Longimicrobium sp.]